MSEQSAKILAHASNLGIVQMPGRNYPGVVIQGDSLAIMFSKILQAATELRKLNADEEVLLETLGLVQQFGGILASYGEACENAGYANSPRGYTSPEYLELMNEYDRMLGYDSPS